MNDILWNYISDTADISTAFKLVEYMNKRLKHKLYLSQLDEIGAWVATFAQTKHDTGFTGVQPLAYQAIREAGHEYYKSKVDGR